MLPESQDALHVSSKCCASLTAARPLLLETAAFGTVVACGFDEHIRLYKLSDARPDRRMASWQWRHWLQLSGHAGSVRDLQPSASSELRLLSCGLDGRVIEWDYATETPVKVVDVGAAALRLLSLPGADDESPTTFCLVAGAHSAAPEELNYRLLRLAPGAPPDPAIRSLLPHCLSAGNHCRFVAGASLGRLLLYRVHKRKFLQHYVCDESTARITALAAHPRERTVAVGLSDSRILLLYNVYSSSRLVRQRLQWHFRPVQCLDFAADGCVLFSGGQEAVLVKWDVSAEGGQSRAFLPRLGAALTGIVRGPGGGLVASLADNSLLVVDTNLAQLGRVHGIFSADQEAPFLLGLVRDPLTDCVALNGTAGTVQFYSVGRQRHLGTLDVVKANYTAVESSVEKVRPAQVELLAFSDKGAWLATFDRREYERYPPEMSLKLWRRRQEEPDSCVSFAQCAEETLNEGARLLSLAFQPAADERKLVCSAEDGTLYCWTREDRVCHFSDPGHSAPVAQWQLTRTWKLGHSFTGGPLAFDASGQLLLTCHQSQLCASVWRTCSLAEPPALFFTNASSARAASDKDVAFCSMWDEGRSVAVCRWDRVCVWDRKSGALLADEPAAVASATEDQKSGMLIVCCADRSLLMLHSNEPANIIRLQLRCPSPPRHLCVAEDTFVFLTEDRRLLVYPEPGDSPEAPQPGHTASVSNLLPGSVSLLSRVFRKEPDCADQLQRRLRLFASADAFAAPNISQFTAQNLRLMRQQLLQMSAQPESEEAEAGRAASLNWRLAAGERRRRNQAGGRRPEASAPRRPALEFGDVPAAGYERALLRCLRRLCADGEGDDAPAMPTMKEIRRQRRQQRRRLKSLRASESEDQAPPEAAVAVAEPTVAVAEPAVAEDSSADVIFVSAEPPPPMAEAADSEAELPAPPPRLPNGQVSVDLDEEPPATSRRVRRQRKRSRSRAAD